jgi:hypothetical protein
MTKFAKALSKEACRFPEDLRVQVRNSGGRQVAARRDVSRKEGQEVEEVSEAPRPAKLVVSAGKANKSEVPLQKIRTNIGRLTDVYKAEGLSRRNDLAFAEDNAINRTVSREHAHILFDKKTGEYRLFNDRWYKRGDKAEDNCGLWIVRDGMGQEVHRDTRGTRLLPGDEIHLGKAVPKFQMK